MKAFEFIIYYVCIHYVAFTFIPIGFVIWNTREYLTIIFNQKNNIRNEDYDYGDDDTHYYS